MNQRIAAASPVQRRIELAGPTVHRAGGVWLTEEVEDARLGEAARRLSSRHEALRTVFRTVDEALVPVVLPGVEPAFVALTAEDGSEEGVLRLAAEFAERGFDPQAPLWRVARIRGDGRQLVVAVLHPRIADADRTVSLVLHELLALARSDGPALPPALAYREIAGRQPVADGPAMAWWREHLAVPPVRLALSGDRTRIGPGDERGATILRVAGEALLPAVARTAASAATGPEVVALAGVVALLQRYTGQTTLLVAIPAPIPAEAGHTVGPVAEPVLLRVDATADDSFHAVVVRTAAAIAAVGERDASAAAAVTAEHPPAAVYFRGAAPRVGAWPVDVAVRPTYALELAFQVEAGVLRLVATTSAEPSEAEAAARLLGHWEVLLASGAAEPGRTLASLPLLTADERATIVEAWNATAVDHGGPDSLQGLFVAQARRTPGAPAVVHAGVRTSYAALEQRAGRLAAHLRGLGVGPDVLVGLYVERSLDLAVGVLGILMAGGAYVPLDPTLPPARLAWILGDTAATLVVAQAALAASLPQHAARVVLVDAEYDDVAAAPARTDPANLGYVIYTSGSTGRPKGVMLPHAALVNVIEWHARTLLGGVPVLQFAAIGFDICFYEMFVAWRTGGVVHMIDEEIRRDPAALAGYIQAHAIAKVVLPVVVLQQLAVLHEDRPEVLRSLREITTTGEQMHLTGPVIALLRRLPGCTLHNHYGPSESHVATAYTLPAAPEAWVPHPPIGRPIDNTRVLVLGPAMNPCPIGVPGEIYIGGVCLARGYLGRPDLTAERFIRDPFSDDPAARLYRTGDVARYRADGDIEYLGRRDDQVKIRGLRIELGEVEAAITRHPRVQETVVVAREDQPGDRRLIAYVVTAERGGDLQAELLAFLRESLPEVMLPAAIVELSALPLTPNGKVDKRALPAPAAATAPGRAPPVAPRTPIEAELAAIWREILRVDAIGVDDGFLELGGHSLAAMQILTRVRLKLGVDVTYQRLFAEQTIARVATWLEGQLARARRSKPLVAADRDRPLPLSLAQERLWFVHQLAPDSTAYTCAYFFQVRGGLDEGALERAFAAIVARHEVFRTSFTTVDGRPVQVVRDRGAIRLERVDLRGVGPEAREVRLRREVDAEVARPFDLGRGPLLRAGVVLLADDERVVWLNVHHIIVDGWSMEVLLRELSVGYAAFAGGAAPVLPALPLQFADHAAGERAALTDPGLQEQVDWWKTTLADAPAILEVPRDRPRPAAQSFRGGTVAARLDAPRTQALIRLGQRMGLTVTTVLLAGFVALLHRYTGESVIVVGMPIAGRDRVETEPMIGLFVNLLPIRVDLTGDPDFEELLRRVQRATLDAYDHDGVPFDRIVQELQPDRALSHNPVVQVSFAPQPRGERDLRLAGLEVGRLEVDARKTIFDLTLYTWEEEAAIEAALEYSADLFDRATGLRMRDHLEALLAGVAEDPRRPLSRVPLMSAAERADAVMAGDGGDPTGPLDETMHAAFERHAAVAPDAPAVLAGGVATNYGALDRRANQLAHHLRGLGVGAGTLVAISVGRSLELIVAVLGVLKAGAAFLPIDPEYPADRREFMLADSGAAVVVTQARLAARFPGEVRLVCLDSQWPEIARGSEHVPEFGAAGDAYVIYTSGSTGRPKGVAVQHRGAVNLARAHRTMFDLATVRVVLQFAALSFDAFVWELLIAWSAGAALCLLPPDLPVPSREFTALLRAQRVSLCLLPPSLLAVQAAPALPDLTHVLAGGEACSAEVVQRWGHGRRFINAYGPTEATVCCTYAVVTPGSGAPPIGGPLPGVRVYVLDAHGEPVPPGVPGELYVGGAGVARGYLGRPELTAERFVQDPFAREPGARMYRTGDRVRRRGDGQLEYLGRLDHQVKLRGFRIELGEIEAALRAHPRVQEAVAVVSPELVAYVVAGAEDVSGDARSEQIDAWRTLYDDTYGRSSADGPAFNITGWASSFTGLPIPAEVMRTWRDHTVDRLAALRPNHVWEIGCGTGLLLLPLAGRCRRYFATDLSARAVADLRRQVAAMGLDHVTIEQRVADDTRGLAEQGFDLVIVNSVIQYFPDAAYLEAVLAGAVARVADGGRVFVGDVRSLPLLASFHAAVQLAQVQADTPVEEVRARVARAAAHENELVVDPRLFAAAAARTPRVSHVEVWLKRGDCRDEMTRYRYDALLFVGDPPPALVVERTWLWGQVADTLAGLERALVAAEAATVAVLGVPNARVAADLAALARLREGASTEEILAAAAPEAVEPEALWALGHRLGYSVRVTYAGSGDLAAIDVLFERGGDGCMRAWAGACPAADGEATDHANEPLRARQQRQLAPSLRTFVQARLPAHMVPSAIVFVDELPLLPNGKVDRRALAAGSREDAARSRGYVHPRSEVEHALADIWRGVLGLTRVGIDDPFFELGGHSLLLAQVRAAIAVRLGRELTMVELFQCPTIRALAEHLVAEPASAAAADGPVAPAVPVVAPAGPPSDAIAVVGMAGRFPGAGSVEQLWTALLAGLEGITVSTPEELAAAGVSPALVAAPRFVPAYGLIDDAYCFDAAFFGYSAHEARLMDPQQRVFLEVAFAALEDSGCDPQRTDRRVGVFAGSDAPRYWLQHVGVPADLRDTEDLQASIANVADNLTSRVTFKLGLRGPAVTVLAACATSLVAVHMACQSLRAGECDAALAGGVAIAPPSQRGYLYEEGGILAPDGHCRPFDAHAGGTVGANGVGVVVLRRLADAIADGDAIRAVIRGSAIGNDGPDQIGFTAPSLRGQAETIRRALAAGGVTPDSVTMIEAHGTATQLGDPIEVAALRRVFTDAAVRPGTCALGSIKSNLGHLGAAAGVAGLIKAVLSLERRTLPATLHHTADSPALAGSPFYVPRRTVEWPADGRPRRAGVSSFGIGGTNAHVVLEEAPAVTEPPDTSPRRWQMLVLSARSEAALPGVARNLADHLDAHPGLALADVAYTLQRRPMLAPTRQVVVAEDLAAAGEALRGQSAASVISGAVRSRPPRPVFVFPGMGTQYVGMGRGLYAAESVFRAAFDECAALLAGPLGEDIRGIVFAAADDEAAAERLLLPSRTMAAVFAVEVALGRQLIAWGLRPAAVVGHSLGEYAAAELAGVMALADAAALVAARGLLCDETPAAALLSVPLSEAALARWLGPGLSLAAINGADACVVAGARADIAGLAAALAAAGVETRAVPVRSAMHSSLIEPVVPRFVERARAVPLHAPTSPIVSSTLGTWLGAEAAEPEYWGRHLRQPVRFADAVATLLADPEHALLEVGPGGQLSGLMRRQAGAERIVVTTMAHPRAGRAEPEALLAAVGRLWCAGADLDLARIVGGERRRNLSLPTYPFARVQHLVDRTARAEAPAAPRPRPAVVVTDPLAQALADIWSDVLGVAVRGADDHFFELGGTSLIAIQIRSQVRERLGVSLPVHALVETPTLGGLLAALREGMGEAPTEAAEARLRVTLRRGDGPPLFLVQPIGGTVYSYLGLVGRLAWDGPILGLRASGMDPGEPILGDIAAIAARYLEEVRAVQPAGTVVLGGHSAGGAIAFEMARQLEAKGERATLVMIDSGSLAAARRRPIVGADDLLREFAAFAGSAPATHEALAAALSGDSPLGAIMLATARALRAYEPPPITSDLVYITASEQLDPDDDQPWAYWLARARGGFSLHRSPGDHFTMMEEPRVEALARLLDLHLRRGPE